MKLELKHLAPYLPYQLKVYRYSTALNQPLIRVLEPVNILQIVEEANSNDPVAYKSMFRPLSDLVKEIEVNGERFIPIDILEEMNYHFGYNEILEHTLSCPFYTVEKLFQWHFDAFGLIEKGLAIDINTI